MTRYGIVLLPEPEYLPALLLYSKEINALAPSVLELNETDTLAHVTVAHFETTRDEADALWSEVKQHARPYYDLNTQSVYLSPDFDAVWVGIGIIATRPVAFLNDAIADYCSEHGGIFPTSGMGDHYWPHITVAKWPVVPHAPLPAALAPIGAFRGTPALAKMGDHGTVTEVLARCS